MGEQEMIHIILEGEQRQQEKNHMQDAGILVMPGWGIIPDNQKHWKELGILVVPAESRHPQNRCKVCDEMLKIINYLSNVPTILVCPLRATTLCNVAEHCFVKDLLKFN